VVRDYRSMSACERVRYYRRCLVAMVHGSRNGNGTLARVFEELIEENLRECPEERDEQMHAKQPS
jgi:hypothetical protein